MNVNNTCSSGVTFYYCHDCMYWIFLNNLNDLNCKILQTKDKEKCSGRNTIRICAYVSTVMGGFTLDGMYCEADISIHPPVTA